jgi:hypothetical protein
VFGGTSFGLEHSSGIVVSIVALVVFGGIVVSIVALVVFGGMSFGLEHSSGIVVSIVALVVFGGMSFGLEHSSGIVVSIVALVVGDINIVAPSVWRQECRLEHCSGALRLRLKEICGYVGP